MSLHVNVLTVYSCSIVRPLPLNVFIFWMHDSCLDSPCRLCAAGALRHGAVGETSGGVQTPQETGRGSLRRGVGGPVDHREQESGHKDAEARYERRPEAVLVVQHLEVKWHLVSCQDTLCDS